MKCEQWAPFLGLTSLSELQLGVTFMTCLETTNRLPCRFYRGLSSVHACGLKVTVELECSSRFFMSHLADLEVVAYVGGCRCAQMSLKSPGGRCNQSQLSSWASPRFEYSLLLFSLPHQQCQGSMLSISSSFFWWNHPWSCTGGRTLRVSRAKVFYSFPAWLWEVTASRMTKVYWATSLSLLRSLTPLNDLYFPWPFSLTEFMELVFMS